MHIILHTCTQTYTNTNILLLLLDIRQETGYDSALTLYSERVAESVLAEVNKTRLYNCVTRRDCERDREG